jgi:hypothetical protein
VPVSGLLYIQISSIERMFLLLRGTPAYFPDEAGSLVACRARALPDVIAIPALVSIRGAERATTRPTASSQ